MSHPSDISAAPTSPITAVLGYAGRGWPVFPCDTQKRPKTTNGFKDGSTDVDLLRDHWVQQPTDTIGVATGNGLLVLDVDDHKDGGAPEWEALLADQGPLPETFTVRTGSGGTHYYFTVDEAVPCSQNRVAKAVDIRCDGGYVIAAPSVSIFGAYEVTDDRDPVSAPAWLIERARRKEVVARAAGEAVEFDRSRFSEEDIARLTTYCDSAVEGELARLRECRTKAVGQGESYEGPPWDLTTFEVACNLLEIANSPWNDLTEADVHTLLLSDAPRDSGFDDARVLAKWDSARKTVGESARPVPSVPVSGGFFIPFDGGTGQVIDPAAFFAQGQGLNTTLLARAVLDMGELAVENNEGRAIWSYRRGVWAYAPNEVSNRVTMLLGGRFRPSHTATVMPMIQALLERQGHVITCEPVRDYINCLNGMLNWRTGVLQDHDPDFYSTVQLPVEWDAGATCPSFDAFVGQVMATDAVDYLWEVIGYMCFSGNPLQRAILLHGAGSNGKGTLIRVLTSLLGSQNTSAVTLQDITEGKFEVASLFGKIANLAGDIDPTYMRSTAKFKAITGEDKIDAQRKFGHPFTFECWATPLFSANEFWKSADTTHGYKRRWLLVPFPNTFTTTSNLSGSLTGEKSGILARAVLGLQALMARGDFDEPKSALIEKDRFELAADQVREWMIDDPAIIASDPKNTAVCYGATEAYRQYRRWAEDSGAGAVSAQKFRQRLQQAGYVMKKSGTMKIVGMQINPSLSHIYNPAAPQHAPGTVPVM